MRKTLLIALAVIGFAACKKSENIHIKAEPARATYHCYIADSIVYSFRTCANSTKFDTQNMYYQPLTNLNITFDSVTKEYMDSVVASTSVEVMVARMAWLFCESNASHDDYDTLHIYKKVIIRY